MLFNPLNAELNPICHLIALLGSATIVVVSRLRVKQVLLVAEFSLWSRMYSAVDFYLTHYNKLQGSTT